MQAIFSPNSDKTGSAKFRDSHIYEAVQRDAENCTTATGFGYGFCALVHVCSASHKSKVLFVAASQALLTVASVQL